MTLKLQTLSSGLRQAKSSTNRKKRNKVKGRGGASGLSLLLSPARAILAGFSTVLVSTLSDTPEAATEATGAPTATPEGGGWYSITGHAQSRPEGRRGHRRGDTAKTGGIGLRNFAPVKNDARLIGLSNELRRKNSPSIFRWSNLDRQKCGGPPKIGETPLPAKAGKPKAPDFLSGA